MLVLLLAALLAGIGMSHIIVDGSIFAKWRGYLVTKYKDTKPWVVELISCYQCSGYWTGIFWGLLLQPLHYWFLDYLWTWLAITLAIPLHLIVTPVVFGFATSYLSMVGAALLNWLDAPAMAVASNKQQEKKDI